MAGRQTRNTQLFVVKRAVPKLKVRDDCTADASPDGSRNPQFGMTLVRYVVSLLYQVTATDLAILALPLIVVFTAALLAAVPAAIRAVRIDPALTLRCESRTSHFNRRVSPGAIQILPQASLSIRRQVGVAGAV